MDDDHDSDNVDVVSVLARVRLLRNKRREFDARNTESRGLSMLRRAVALQAPFEALFGIHKGLSSAQLDELHSVAEELCEICGPSMMKAPSREDIQTQLSSVLEDYNRWQTESKILFARARQEADTVTKQLCEQLRSVADELESESVRADNSKHVKRVMQACAEQLSHEQNLFAQHQRVEERVVDSLRELLAFVQAQTRNRECCVCQESASSVTFACAHRVCCEECAEKLHRCPLCRMKI